LPDFRAGVGAVAAQEIRPEKLPEDFANGHMLE
jgi:hypothetical protein